MKLIPVIALCACVALADEVVPRRVAAGVAEVDAAGRIEHWPAAVDSACVLRMSFDADRDASFWDWSSEGNDGSGTNAATTPTWNSAAGGVMAFDGTDDVIHFTTGLVSLAGLDGCAWAAWLNVTTHTNRTAMLAGERWSATISWQYLYNTTPESYRLRIDTAGGLQVLDVGNKTVDEVSAWVHYAWTFDRTNIVIYRNGTLNTNVAHAFPGVIKTTSAPVLIGARPTTDAVPYGCADFSMPTSMDDVCLFNRVLTADEVLAIYNATRH